MLSGNGIEEPGAGVEIVALRYVGTVFTGSI
jgi:hypothetical protein